MQQQPLLESPSAADAPMTTFAHSQSRQMSTVFPVFHSSLSYALVRDFAYPPYNPLHYGPERDNRASSSSPDGDYDGMRRVSDPPPWEASLGPWRDNSYDSQGHQLPSTSFEYGGEGGDDSRRQSMRFSKHRKSKSYADMDYARGRRRDSRELGRSRQREEPPAHIPYRQAGGTSDSPFDDRYDSAHSQQHHNSSQPLRQDDANDTSHPPFREDTDSVPYSPSALEEHRPESASLDEAFAGPSLALYDFHPENDNELPLREGQVIQVGYRHGQGWLVAANVETGEQGLVPEEYVRLLRDIEGGWPSQGHEETDEGEEGGSPDTEHVSSAEQAADQRRSGEPKQSSDSSVGSANLPPESDAHC